MDVLNRKSLLLGMALCMSGAAVAQVPNTNAPAGPVTSPAVAPKPAPYDCFGLAGVALRNCTDLNAAAASAGNSRPSTSHDCGGMTGAALATCRELNGEISAPPVNTYNPAAYGNYGTPAYVAPGMASGSIPPAGTGNPTTGTDSSSGSNPTSISPGSGTTGSSSGSNPTGLSGGSGKSPSSSAPAPSIGSNANPSTGGKLGM